MTPRLEAELSQKRRRLFYDRASGSILGVASGGGALEAMRGEALIIATFNDVAAYSTIGVVECYYAPIGRGKPHSVDLVKVRTMESTSQVYRDHLETDHNNINHQFGPDDHECCGDIAVALCAARDAAVSYNPSVSAL